MEVIKKINNNAAICVDNNQNEVIAFGKGIGFPNIPYELTDLSCIKRTYYGINPAYIGLINEIPEEVFEISARVVDIAKNHIDNEMNANIVFTLADHINFAIQRYQKNLIFKIPFSYDIQYLYETEMKIGEQTVKMIKKELNIQLAKEEAASIALHFINAQNMKQNAKGQVTEEGVIQDLTNIIEQTFDIHIDKRGFNYSRFVTHLQYLLKRREEDVEINSENRILYEAMIKEFPETNECVNRFITYLSDELQWRPCDEEKLYLMLHINRLCAREDCYQ